MPATNANGRPGEVPGCLALLEDVLSPTILRLVSAFLRRLVTMQSSTRGDLADMVLAQ